MFCMHVCVQTGMQSASTPRFQQANIQFSESNIFACVRIRLSDYEFIFNTSLDRDMTNLASNFRCYHSRRSMHEVVADRHMHSRAHVH
jgi:hypothetical protein